MEFNQDAIAYGRILQHYKKAGLPVIGYFLGLSRWVWLPSFIIGNLLQNNNLSILIITIFLYCKQSENQPHKQHIRFRGLISQR